MAASPPPNKPPWKPTEQPTPDQRNFYETYLLAEIKGRDEKHGRLAGHVRDFCQ